MGRSGLMLLIGASLLVVVAMAGWFSKWGRLEEAAKPVTLPESRTVTLAELAQVVSDQTGIKLVVQQDHEGRQLFISQGTYELQDLLAAVRSATRLSLKKVGQTYMLFPAAATMGVQEYPPLPRALNDRSRAVFEAAARRVNLGTERIPFEAPDFLAGRTIRFSDLTPEQQAFVKQRYRRDAHGEQPYFATVPPPSPVTDEAKATAALQQATIRLGTTIQLCLMTYELREGEQQRFSPTWMELVPIYDDARDRSDILLPDD